MLISMTGYGKGAASGNGVTVTVEVRTVNHRFLDFSLKLPRSLSSRERDVKDRVRRRLTRGRIYVTIVVERPSGERDVQLNEGLMARYLELLRAFAGRHQLEGAVALDSLLQLPDVVAVNDDDGAPDEVWPLVEKSLDGAVEACHRMRLAEGESIETDLRDRSARIGETVVHVERLAPTVVERHAKAFRSRVQTIVGDVAIDSDRVAAEIAIMVDRLDISEEITRLKSHIQQFDESLAVGGEVSKKLTYLLQEMHREASTIGAKASDSDVTNRVIALKEETEKLREQVQNVE